MIKKHNCTELALREGTFPKDGGDWTCRVCDAEYTTIPLMTERRLREVVRESQVECHRGPLNLTLYDLRVAPR